MKIVDKINASVAAGKTFFSFEFFPPRTEEGVENLVDRAERMAAYGPMFCDITWGAGGTTADATLEIARKMQNQVCVETMMHLTCTNMAVSALESALSDVRSMGVQNILALRGDPPKGQETFTQIEGGFACALDLVRYIRQEHGDYFGITVAGYPEAHPDSIVDDAAQMAKNYAENLAYLKQKVDAGGEVIVTQLFYDVDRFTSFVSDCRALGITAPILPGIMPIMTYAGFKRMTGFCKTYVPPAVEAALEAIKDDEEAVRNYGIDLGVEMCRKLLAAGTPGLHMYTLNLERSAAAILERLGLLDVRRLPRPLPWRHVPRNAARGGEGVRPIFWANRPRAYLARTAAWGAAPNKGYPAGAWASGPGGAALAPLPNGSPFLCRHRGSEKKAEKARAAWGAELAGGLADVQGAFTRYVRGESGLLPWAEAEELARESAVIAPRLAALCAAGLLTVNSQPAVNGAASDDPAYGWGAPGGRVYQKGYVEFFVAPGAAPQLLERLAAAPSITYLAATRADSKVSTNLADPAATVGVTWGVFPGSEVRQPTVVDAASFAVWKDEAFALWRTEWASLYEAASASAALLQEIADTWWLVAVVDDDFVSGDVFAPLGVPDAVAGASIGGVANGRA